jgi:hypothetical protein
MKMPGCEFSKANFLASPRDLPSGARVFLTVEAELANGSKAWRFNERPLECPLTSWESPNGFWNPWREFRSSCLDSSWF